MKLKTLYELAVMKGLKEDLRPKRIVDEALKKAKKDRKKRKGSTKRNAAFEKIIHPYDDCAVLYGSPEKEIKNVMVGIDIDVSELLLADRLREKGVNVDLVISHHPSGWGYVGLSKVMSIQPGIWEKYGIDAKVAKGMMKDRMDEVARGVAPANHSRTADAAKLLDIPFMCLHTPADNCVASFLQKTLDKKKPKKLKNVVSILQSIPEFKDAAKSDAGPFVLIGKDTDAAGKIFVDMTGGTSGPDRLFPRLSQAGVNTFVGMHCRESGYKVAKSEFLNYVIAGHIASDNLGMNILFDAVEKKGKLNFIECSGFRRMRRKRK